MIAIVNQMLANAAQQPELPEDDEQEQFNPLAGQEPIEDYSQEQMQMPVDANIDLSQLNLPDVVQQNEAQ